MSTDLDSLRDGLAAPLAHPDPAAWKELGEHTLAWLAQHLASLPDQAIGRTASRAELERLLREPAPEKGTDFHQVLAEFVQNDRNRMMYITYKFGGFKEREKHGDLVIFEHDLQHIPPFPPYVQIRLD